jgi:hypothetical protein
MGRIVVMNHLTLDGVMQGSGPPAKTLEVVSATVAGAVGSKCLPTQVAKR